jgi:hypothetical protein
MKSFALSVLALLVAGCSAAVIGTAVGEREMLREA